MDCKEFRELFAQNKAGADLEHLIECPKCLAEFGPDPFQQRVKAAGIGADQFRIRDGFSDSLAAGLRSEFFAEENARPRTSLKLFVPVFSLLLLVAGLGFYGLQRADIFGAGGVIADGLTEIGRTVAGNHVYCTLEKAGFWDKLSDTEYPEKAKYQQAVLAPLRTGYSESVSLVSVHGCAFDGVPFKHVILRDGKTLVSVFVQEANEHAPQGENPIVTKFEKGFQMASFAGRASTIFVVSDLPETKNLTIARTLSYTMNEISYLAAF